MNTALRPLYRPLKIYLWLPAILLNLASLCILAAYFTFYYAEATGQPALVSPPTPGQIQFWTSALIFVVEWGFALALICHLRRCRLSLSEIFVPGGSLWKFRWLPALLMFLGINVLMLAYIIGMDIFWPSVGYEDLTQGQRLTVVLLIPITAAFCEELIWRGYVLPGLRANRRSRWSAILIATVSFALIHGVFLPDKLLMTFLFGIITGYYALIERNLIPLMFTHWFVDLWSFGWLLLR
jgi:membrane protease YdiL (CAAX protease family)